ncbi:MAG: HupE/UreJ family protein [bacterium]|nr:HupE/UreJ family protein [bacterium]
MLKVTEHSPGRVSVEWKTPLQAVPGTRLQPVMPPHCAPQGESKKENKGGAYVQRWKAHCQDSLVGSSFAVRGILESKADVILRVGLADGRTFNTVLTEDRVVFVVPKRESPLDLGRSYLILGFDHILTGLDHLLFILGLVLLISHGRQLLWTVTAFTLGHSLTLSLAALGLVNIPTAPVEALIALSIVALALELTRAKKTPPTFFHRFPWVMALGFGLLHGLGFAGALAEVGLPTGDIPLALFSFNVGIEMGQLLFIAGILMVRALWRLISLPYSTLAYRLIVYGIGSLSAYWFLERIFSVW